MIAIMDYGMGNLRSVQKAFEYLGYQAEVTDDQDVVLKADHVVLPGVGAFRDAMARLRETGLYEAALEVAKRKIPFLGICLGMQLMFEASEENGHYEGLGLLPGTITRFPEMGLKIPHMGWNTLDTKDCVLFDAGQSPCVYFVHSYLMAGICPEWTAATALYGIPFTAVAQKGTVVAAQFHPEKSGEDGLNMLRRFAAWNPPKGSGTLPPPVADMGGVEEAGETSSASGSEAMRRLSQMEVRSGPLALEQSDNAEHRTSEAQYGAKEA